MHRLIRTAATLAALALLSYIPARAGDDTVELAVAGIDVSADPAADELDGQGVGYDVAYLLPLSKHGHLAAHFALSRVDGIGAAGQGGWSLAAGGQAILGDTTTLDGDPVGLVQAYGRYSFGVTWADTYTATQEVPATGPGAAAESETIEIPLDVSEQYVTAAVAAGVRILFDRGAGLGAGVEAAYRTPLSDGVPEERAGSVRVFLTLPAGAQR